MEPEYLRKFLALGLAGVWTPNRQSVGKLAPVVLMICIIKGNTVFQTSMMAPKCNFSERNGGI